jgi:hypothetical protein
MRLDFLYLSMPRKASLAGAGSQHIWSLLRTFALFVVLESLAGPIDAATLSVIEGAAHNGDFGLRVRIDDTNAAFARDDSPHSELRLRTRFYMLFGQLALGTSDAFDLLSACADDGEEQLRLTIKRVENENRLGFAARLDDSGFAESPPADEVPLRQGWMAVEIDWAASSAPDADDGYLQLWVDGIPISLLSSRSGLSGLDNDASRVDSVKWGAVKGFDLATSGLFDLDDYVSKRGGEMIGLTPGHGSLDIDGSDGTPDALSDGLLILRFLFGFRGDPLIEGVVPPDAPYFSAPQLEVRLQKLCEAGVLDIDGNGTCDSLTDGLLILRFLFGFRGSTLIDGAVAPDCGRCTTDEIESFLNGLI